MYVINLTYKEQLIKYKSFGCILHHSKEIWLLNCGEGCQHILKKYNLKISCISKIIITNLNIENISGLLGLLSSLSLSSRRKKLSIYSPKGLDQYLTLGKKYSQTNFRYHIYFYNLITGLIIHNNFYQVYSFKRKQHVDLIIIQYEKFGKFQLSKAKQFYLLEGPLYGKLKRGADILLPDGLILNSNHFTNNNIRGVKQSFISNKYSRRRSIELSKNSKLLHYYK